MHDVFHCAYSEIAVALGKSEAACRQLVHRAREWGRRDKPRFDVSDTAHRQLVERYVKAVQERDASISQNCWRRMPFLSVTAAERHGRRFT
ncbi:sigma factor-like helix-turn-helix DNA-binding protein [Nitratireductor rhodophyticola]